MSVGVSGSVGVSWCANGYDQAMATKIKKGDKVSWNAHGKTVHGTVKDTITSETEAAGRKVKASKDEPQYLVESDKTGAEAVHKPSALDT